MSHSMAWVTMKLRSGGAELSECGCGCACLYNIKWCTLDMIFVKLPTTIYYWMPNDSKQNQIKPTNEEKKTHTLSQNVTSTGMISIEIYSPRDLFILFFSFSLSLFILVCVDFTWFQIHITLVLFKFVYNIMFHWIDFISILGKSNHIGGWIPFLWAK